MLLLNDLFLGVVHSLMYASPRALPPASTLASMIDDMLWRPLFRQGQSQGDVWTPQGLPADPCPNTSRRSWPISSLVAGQDSRALSGGVSCCGVSIGIG